MFRAAKHSDKAFLFVLDPAVNDALLVRWVGGDFARTYANYTQKMIDVTLEETSRGLVL